MQAQRERERRKTHLYLSHTLTDNKRCQKLSNSKECDKKSKDDKGDIVSDESRGKDHCDVTQDTDHESLLPSYSVQIYKYKLLSTNVCSRDVYDSLEKFCACFC